MSNDFSPLASSTNEVTLTPYTGVTYHKVFRFNAWAYVLIFQKGVANFGVTKFGRKVVSQVQRETKANFVINGGDYNAYHAVGLHVVNGGFQSPQVDYQPFVNFTKEQVTQILPWNSWTRGYNAVAAKRFIVENGAVALRHSNAWYEEHPRTLIGVGKNGETIMCIIDGRQDNGMTGFTQGVDLFEGAKIMVEFGAQTAIDLDGGGSSTMNMDGITMNSPIDENIVGKERAVGTHITVFIKDAPVVTDPPPSEESVNFTVKVPVRPRPQPSMFSVSTEPNLPVDYTFSGYTTFAGGMEWAITPNNKYVPLVYKGVTYVAKTTVPVEPTKKVFGQVLDWYDWAGKNMFDYFGMGNNIQNDPAVGQFAQVTGDAPILVTKRISDWWYKLTQEVTPSGYPHDEIVKTLLNLTMGKKAFTNKMGWDEANGDRNEYWTGVGDNKGEDMGLQYVWSVGSTYEIIGEIRIAGKDCWKIRAFDAFDPKTYEATYKGNEHMFTIATSNSRANNVEGFISNPFPRLYNRSVDGFSRVLVPLMANHRTELYIPKQLIKILPEGSQIPAYPYRQP